jgi:hypothetical protein
MMKKFNKEDQRKLAIWAAECAERVLPFFEKAYPEDDRPRKAIKACRAWIRTGVFNMNDIRKAALASHAAARESKENNTACFAARAAGQALATAHVPQHAFGAAYYALKVILEVNPNKVDKEFKWQSQHLAKGLRQEWQEWQSQNLPKYLKILLNP